MAKRARPSASGSSRIRLAANSGDPLYQQVKDYIEKQVSSGKWPRGYRLPTVRQMSADLKIAYATVARGVRELVSSGLLEARSGRGTHVASQRKRRLQTIGIAGFVSYQTLLHTTRYYRQLLLQIQERIIDLGRTVVYSQWTRDKTLGGMFDDLRLVDGILLLGAEESRLEEVRQVQRMGTPVVCLGDTVPRSGGVPTVHGANEDDSRRAVEHLLSLGHRHVACCMVTPKPAHAGIEGRLLGYQRAMEKSAAGYDRHYHVRGQAALQAQQLLALKPAPTAIFVPEGVSELSHLHEFLRGTPLQIGRNLFACVYDENLWDNLSPLGISYLSIEQPLSQIAAAGVDGLLRMLGEPGYVAGYTEVPSQIVLVSEDGSRRGI